MPVQTHIPAVNASLPASALSGPSATRLQSLDIFRGMVVAGMILVTDPGTYSAVYRPLMHAQWQGWTPTDMIAPAFLWIVGMAIPFSLANQQAKGVQAQTLALRILRRTALLILLELLLNGFPYYRLATLRIPGILQHIALCYGAGGLLALAVLRRGRGAATQAGILAALAALTWTLQASLLLLLPVPGYGSGHFDELRNAPGFIDRAVFTTAHLWPYGIAPGHGVTFDPDGLGATLPALGNLLAGAAAGVWLRAGTGWRRCALQFAGLGALLFAAGLTLAPMLPIIKKLWTPSYALLSCGVSLLAFAALYALLDGLRVGRRFCAPFLVFGTNAILAFAVSTVITTSLDAITLFEGGQSMRLHAWLYLHWFATWMLPVHASLAYAITIVLLNWLVLVPLYRKQIFLRL